MDIPPTLDYEKAFPMLRGEDREKLGAARPLTLHAAGRVQGVTPSALMKLFQYVKAHPEVPLEHRLDAP